MGERPTFETLKSEEIKFGTRNFLEVAKKKAISQGPEGVQENEFVQIARGFYGPTGEKRWKKGSSVVIPPDQVKAVIDALKKIEKIEKE